MKEVFAAYPCSRLFILGATPTGGPPVNIWHRRAGCRWFVPCARLSKYDYPKKENRQFFIFIPDSNKGSFESIGQLIASPSLSLQLCGLPSGVISLGNGFGCRWHKYKNLPFPIFDKGFKTTLYNSIYGVMSVLFKKNIYLYCSTLKMSRNGFK
jgi:hypothetical protein